MTVIARLLYQVIIIARLLYQVIIISRLLYQVIIIAVGVFSFMYEVPPDVGILFVECSHFINGLCYES